MCDMIDFYEPPLPRNPFWFIIAVIIATLVVITISLSVAHAETASWYDRASCIREGTSGIMANGEVLDDSKFTAAMWGVKFGTRVRVTNLSNGRSCIVTICDRGPAKRLVKKGRIIDLSYASMRLLDGIERGIIPVEIKILE